MNAPALQIAPFGARTESTVSKVLWHVTLFVAVLLLANHAMASGGGNALTELNDWLESELGGSVGLTIALVSFLSGLIAAVATRSFMPIVWGIGVGLVLGIFLAVVVGTLGAALPYTALLSAASALV